MDLPAVIATLRTLAQDTFRQARASGLYWAMLAVSAVCVLFCLGVGVEGDVPLVYPQDLPEFLPRHTTEDPAKVAADNLDTVRGELTLAFGAFRVHLGRDRADAVRFVQLLLAGGVADTAGVLLALIWTAGFLPTFLEPQAVTVLLAKPVPRWCLLIGKYLGVLAFVGFQATVFVTGTWLALALKTGVWDTRYFLAVPLLLLHFAIFFSFSTWLAVWRRSTVVCVIGSILFWLLCWGMNYGRHALVALDSPPAQTAGVNVSADQHGLSPALRGVVETAYWVVPKPADLGILFFDSLQAGPFTQRLPEFQTVVAQGKFDPELSVLASLAFTAVLLAVAARQFVTTDY